MISIVNVEAVDIPDCGFQCVYNIFDYGKKYTVERGSFENETRLQFDAVNIHIKYPYNEPGDLMLPKIPETMNIPNPVEPGYVEQYLPYIMTDHIEPEESYTYGSRIREQIDFGINVLKETPYTNQATLQVAQPHDYILEDPPCLREIQMKVINGNLVFYPVGRSWDLWSGLPANLAGLAVLQKYMSDEIGLNIGSMVAFSSGLHIYGYTEEIAKIRANK